MGVDPHCGAEAQAPGWLSSVGAARRPGGSVVTTELRACGSVTQRTQLFAVAEPVRLSRLATCVSTVRSRGTAARRLGVGGAVRHESQHVHLAAGDAESGQPAGTSEVPRPRRVGAPARRSRSRQVRASSWSSASSSSARTARSTGTGRPHVSTTAHSTVSSWSTRRSQGSSTTRSWASAKSSPGRIPAAVASGRDRFGAQQRRPVGRPHHRRQCCQCLPGLGVPVGGDGAQQGPESEVVDRRGRGVAQQRGDGLVHQPRRSG